MTEREKFEAWFYKDCEFIKSSANADNLAWIKHGYWTAWQAALASQRPADDGWIEWAGDECPVDEDVLVEVRWRFGATDIDKADCYDWVVSKSSDKLGDIIAYRVVKP